MKGEKLKTYLEGHNPRTNDFNGQILDQITNLRRYMNLKSIESGMYNIILDSLLTLEAALRGLEWNKEIEREWNAAQRDMVSKLTKTDSGKIVPRLELEYRTKKMYIDFEYMIKMCLDVGIIDRNLNEVVNNET
jgi:hypothetical protein